MENCRLSKLKRAVVVVLIVLAQGCGTKGPPLGDVKGSITLDDKPLSGATVEFQPASGAPSYGESDANGTYELYYTVRRTGALLGAHTVRITTAGEVTNEEGITVRVPERLSEKYNYSSELRRTAEKGENVFDFELRTSP